MNLVLLGGPGAGKGTQARCLEKRTGWPHISTGQMLRSAQREGSPLGREAQRYMKRGALVPDAVVVGIVRERLARPDCTNGFILDGFPRTVAQADALDVAGVTVDRVLSYEVPEEELVRRLAGRRTCAGCGAMYHEVARPPARPGVCDRCGATLIRRADDDEGAVRARLTVHARETRPLVDHYRRRGQLVTLDGAGGPNEVFARTVAALGAAADEE